jgi:phenylpropionate dioxygenase-like ring-hydroxylating dioxygenase large terminal subunit
MASAGKVLKPKYPTQSVYPRNQWYVAAFSRDVGSEPLARVLLDTPIVMYRTAGGVPVALYDRCPHRALPLSMGKVDGDILRCGYHGIEFAADGKAIHVPQQSQIYPSLCVTSFPVVEKGPFLWIWLGNKEAVDHSLLPGTGWISFGRDDEHIVPYLTVEIDAHFQLVHDNLADLCHLPYVHAGFLDDGSIDKGDFTFREDGQAVYLERRSSRITLPPQVAALYRVEADKQYDRFFENSTFLPSLCLGRQILTEADNPDAKPIMFLVVNAVTPSTASKTFMFDVQGYLVAHGSDEDKARIKLVIEQDINVWHAIQQRYDQFGDTAEVSIIGDKAGLASRRIFERLVVTEQEAGVTV